MKKLIVLSVVFALVAVAAFAVDLGGTVIGTVDLFQGESGTDDASSDITGGGSMNRIRIDGGGEAGDGKFGGYFRWDGGLSGNAWWKPIDQLKLMVGSNGGDGFYGKEGNTGWMFYQTVSDTGVVSPGNCWGGGYGTVVFRDAFFGGDGGGDALRLEITPMDILGINIQLPYFDGGKAEDIFKKAIAQIDLKLDFGNIALTYRGGMNDGEHVWEWDPSKIYIYYGGSFGDLALDFGFCYTLGSKDPEHDDAAVANPMGVGLGLKFATDAFGVKFRVVATLGGDDKTTMITTDIMPYFSLGDNITAFVSAGIGMLIPDEGDQLMGWHFNPYVQIGEEWGAKFLVGVKVYQNTCGPRSDDDGWDYRENKLMKWSVPIAVVVSF